jgi:lysyl-tRNA synthetase, class II
MRVDLSDVDTTPGGAMIVQIERHSHGPRLFVLGVRVHECHLGIALLGTDLAGLLAHAWAPSLWSVLVALAGGWMLLKDGRDLVPSLRDTGSWRLGVHRRFAPLRALRYADGLPTLAGAIAFAVGAISLISAATPNIAWRRHLLLSLEPVRAVPIMHTLAIPASAALIMTSFFLRARRRRAWQAGIMLLVALGAIHLLKGLDFEEAALSWAAASLLWWGRASFVVRHERLSRRSLLSLVIGVSGVALLAVVGLVWISLGADASASVVARDTLDLLSWAQPSHPFRDDLAWLPLAVGVFGLAVVVVGGYVFFRPLPPPQLVSDRETRSTVNELVREHGSDTLAFFKLRRDMHYLFSPDRRSFLGYRIEGNVLLVAGDPVGAGDALPTLVRDACSFAEVRGLKIAVLGASTALLPLWHQAGLRSLYIGDEAMLETKVFSLEGRAIRKVRQSVNRLENAGYVAHAEELSTLDPETLMELERIARLWRAGAAERGFSMAMDSLRGEYQADSIVVWTSDASGAVKGFLHFVPAFGRSAMSLSFMRRERNTPNGLTEFLIVKAVELLRERGVDELSLNFAAFGRLLERPSGRIERALGRLVALGNRYFQIESLYRFNAKFSPRWEPRYLIYETVLGLPRVGVAAMRAEGQLPKLRS